MGRVLGPILSDFQIYCPMLRSINKVIEDLEFYRYSVMSITITAGSCIGSFAVFFMSQSNAPVWQMALCGGISMMSNAMAIAMAPIKWLVWTFIASVFINVALVLMNF